MKKIVNILLIVCFVLGVTGCGNVKDSDGSTYTSKKIDQDQIEIDKDSEVALVENDIKDDAESDVKFETDNEGENAVNTGMIPELTFASYNVLSNDAMEFVNNMKIGWNLGNTFDAIDNNKNFKDELKYESIWSGIVTTKEMIDCVKNAGFNTIRIPVSWHNHVSGEEFIISEVWMNRVQEVVDYAMENEMYIILNIHHDIGEDYIYPNSQNLETSKKYITSIWGQVSARFQDYDEHIIFEGMNEPRLMGTENEWWLDSNNKNCIDAVDCINQLNQSFVDTVRAGAGYNASRYVMVSGYCASPEGALSKQFKLPIDTLESKMIVSVHAYTPYRFALQDLSEVGSVSQFSSSNEKDTRDIDSFMDELYSKYISLGIPVIIGEFGARDKNTNLLSRVEYATYYIGAARARGIICCWWDNNSYSGSGENFGILNRKKVEWEYPEIVKGLMKY